MSSVSVLSEVSRIHTAGKKPLTMTMIAANQTTVRRLKFMTAPPPLLPRPNRRSLPRARRGRSFLGSPPGTAARVAQIARRRDHRQHEHQRGQRRAVAEVEEVERR